MNFPCALWNLLGTLVREPAYPHETCNENRTTTVAHMRKKVLEARVFVVNGIRIASGSALVGQLGLTALL